LLFRGSREHNRITVFEAEIHNLDDRSLGSQAVRLDDNRPIRSAVLFKVMREVLELYLLVAIIDQGVRAGGDTDNDRVFLRPQDELRKWEVYADSGMQEKSGTHEEEQQQQETNIYQRNEKDEKRV
jgi:hypothetical protein